MEKVDFDKLDELSIPELEAIRSFSVVQLKENQAMMDKYKNHQSTVGSAQQYGNWASFYEALADHCQNYLDIKIFKVVGRPNI